MGRPVVTVAAGGLPVVDATAFGKGTPVTEDTNGRGLAVTKVALYGIPVCYETFGMAPAFAALNPASATANVALSNSNLTATHTNTSSDGVAALPFLSSGKYYFEFKNTVVVSSSDNIGFMLSGSNPAFTNDATNVIAMFGGATFIYVNNVSTGGDFGGRTVGDLWGIAVDLSSRLAWFRKNGGLWNLSAPANPATGVGGFTIAAGSYAPKISVANATSGQVYTANFGASAFANAAPSGFVGWPSS